eukprot:scaffold16311_cov66-Isochrysis_galbana.AAC.1
MGHGTNVPSTREQLRCLTSLHCGLCGAEFCFREAIVVRCGVLFSGGGHCLVRSFVFGRWSLCGAEFCFREVVIVWCGVLFSGGDRCGVRSFIFGGWSGGVRVAGGGETDALHRPFHTLLICSIRDETKRPSR